MKRYLSAALLACTMGAFGQNAQTRDTIFFEGFESATFSLPSGWTQVYMGSGVQPSDLEWEAASGGASHKPAAAHAGEKNALLYFDSNESQRIYLISPAINIRQITSSNKIPVLKFWYSQYASISDDDTVNYEFSVYYRFNNTGKWQVLGKPFTQPTDDSEPWRCASVLLPGDVRKDANEQIQIAFLGTTQADGYGCCIDNVLIAESDYFLSEGFEGSTASLPNSWTQEYKTEYNVTLKSVGPNRDAVITLVKNLVDVTLEAATELVNNPPKDIMVGVSKLKADKVKSELESAGARIELKQIDGQQPTSLKWKLEKGGPKPTGSDVRKPETAHGGEKNAILYYLTVQHKYKMYLVSPDIDFSLATKPMLTFWYSQYADRASFTDSSSMDNFEFTLHYRIHNGDSYGEWQQFGTTYNRPTDDSEPWRCDTVQLPDDVQGKTNVQIAFLGTTKTVGHGCCIDDVSIFEAGNKWKWVEDISAMHPSTNVIPTNSTDNAILRMRVKVNGNAGSLKLNTLTATALNKTIDVVDENGVKLFYTQTETFNSDSPLGTTSVGKNGKAVFSNIGKELAVGSNYLWIACNIKKDHNHDMKGKIIDMKIDTCAVGVSLTIPDTTATSGEITTNYKYPDQTTGELSPNGNRVITESIFIDNFEDSNYSDLVWVSMDSPDNEFEIAKAKYPALGGTSGGNSDPSNAHSGHFMLGTDITGLGDQVGNYEKNIGSNQYFAESKTFDCYYYKEISLMFYRWLNICNSDTATVGISLDGGATWSNLWASSAVIQDKDWSFQYLNLNKVADRCPSVKFRFTLGPTRSGLAYSGWNIDDVALVGTYIYKDAALAEIVEPNTDCGRDSAKVTVRLMNVGANDIKCPEEDSLYVCYSIDGGASWVTERIDTVIKRSATMQYTFKTTADLSQFGPYDIVAKVMLTDSTGNSIDEDNRNDYALKTIMSLPYHQVPYAQNDDSISTFWFGNADTWQYGRLLKKDADNILKDAEKILPRSKGSRYAGTWQYDSKPKYASSPCWHTFDFDDNGNCKNYATNDSAWLETSCFDMSLMQKPIVEFKLRGNTSSASGLAVYYSVNNGKVWKLMTPYPSTAPHPDWSWYNSWSVSALNSAGWSGRFGWRTIKQLLPDEVAGQDSVKFRFVFASDATSGDFDGFAISDFRLYESPADAGIASILEPVDACELLEEQPITVSIKNFGLRGIIPTDSIIASVVINDKLTLTDTLFVSDTLAVGDTIHHTFGQTVNMWYKKAYKMTAFTQVANDTMQLFVGSIAQHSGMGNDTLRATATVLGEPQYDLGPDIGTIDPEKDTLNAGVKANGANFEGYKWFATKEAFESGTPIAGENRTLTGLRKFKLMSENPELEEDETEYYYYVEVKSVAGGLECFERDSVKIINSSIDVGIEYLSGLEVNGEHKFCREREFNDIKVKINIENKSADGTVTDDFGINIGYKMLDADSNLVSFIDTTVVYTKDLAAHDTGWFEYTFRQQPKFMHDSLQSIYFFTTIWADLNPSNNTDTVADVVVWPLPTVALGDDVIESFDPKSLVLRTDSIAGATYVWLNCWDSTELTTNSNIFTVTDSVTVKYKVSVTDIHSCATVSDSVTVVTDDWSFAELISPIDQCDTLRGMDITVSLVNNSYNSYGSGYRIPATVKVNGSVQRDTIVLTDSVFAFDTINYTLRAKADFPEVGRATVNVNIKPLYDINRADSSNLVSKEVHIWGIPRLDLGFDTIFTLQPDTILLDAGSVVSGTEFSWFEWNEKSEYASQEYNVKDDDIKADVNIIYVFAINEHGCYADDQKIDIYNEMLSDTAVTVATDTVRIISANVEFGEGGIVSPSQSCDITAENGLKIAVRNNGKTVIRNGTELPVKVQINDKPVQSVSFKLKEQLKVDATTQLSIPFATNFNGDSTYNIKAWLDWDLDRFRDNDTAVKTITQYPHPDIFTLGDDIYTTQPDTVMLRAPENLYDYSWSNGVEGVNTIALPNSASASYSVKVFNEYNCVTADTVSVLTYDLDFMAYTNSKEENSNHCDPIENAPVHGKILVKSLDEIPAGTNLTANFDFNGTTGRYDVTLPAPINKDRPYVFDFKERINIPDTGDYHMTSNLKVNNMFVEADTANFKEIEFRIGTYPLPFEDTVSTYDKTYTIETGKWFTAFDWYTEQHHDGPTLTVVNSANYALKATDINGCEAKDSTYVLFIKPSYKITDIDFATRLCENAEPSVISFYLKNTGNDIIATGSQADISFMTNDSVLIQETFTFSRTIREGDSILVSFKKKADFSKVGTDSVRLTAVIAGYETRKTVAVTTQANPVVSLGDDFATTCTDTILTVGAGFARYLWNTGDTVAGISISKDGDYWVKVADELGCSGADTVHAHFIPATVAVAGISSPKSDCGSITDQLITFEVINNSKTIVKSGQRIGVTCKIDNMQELEYLAELQKDFAPNEVFSDSIAERLTISTPGTHTLSFITSVDGVVNDTSEFFVEVYSLPELSFGIDTIKPEEYPYTLKASTSSAELTYMWSTNETTDTISIGTDSTYTLKVTDRHGCWAIDSVVVRKIEKIVPPDTTPIVPPDTTPVEPPIDTTPVVRPGISIAAVAKVVIYPNPTDNILNVDFGEFVAEERRILIANATGQIIFASKQTADVMQINVADWADGMYFIKIEGDGGSRILKFVKQ